MVTTAEHVETLKKAGILDQQKRVVENCWALLENYAGPEFNTYPVLLNRLLRAARDFAKLDGRDEEVDFLEKADLATEVGRKIAASWFQTMYQRFTEDEKINTAKAAGRVALILRL